MEELWTVPLIHFAAGNYHVACFLSSHWIATCSNFSSQKVLFLAKNHTHLSQTICTSGLRSERCIDVNDVLPKCHAIKHTKIE